MLTSTEQTSTQQGVSVCEFREMCWNFVPTSEVDQARRASRNLRAQALPLRHLPHRQCLAPTKAATQGVMPEVAAAVTAMTTAITMLAMMVVTALTAVTVPEKMIEMRRTVMMRSLKGMVGQPSQGLVKITSTCTRLWLCSLRQAGRTSTLSAVP